MAHIHTEPGEHDHTASAFIVRLDPGEPKILLHLHKKLRRYIQFGGHIEIEENPWQAVVHEVREESGYDVGQLKLLQPYSRLRKATGTILHPVAFSHNTHMFNENHYHTDLGYAFVTSELPSLNIGEDESEDIVALTRQQLVDLPAEKTHESVREAALFVLDVCIKEWEAVDTSTFSLENL